MKRLEAFEGAGLAARPFFATLTRLHIASKFSMVHEVGCRGWFEVSASW
jgi:hypothetical protein